MKEEGFVKSISGDKCEVVVRRKTACGDNCASCKGACRMNFQTVTAKNTANSKIGDNVVIEMDSKKVYLSAFLVYILPLMVFILAYYFGDKIFDKIAVTVVFAVIMTITSIAPAMAYDRLREDEFLPVVTKILEK